MRRLVGGYGIDFRPLGRLSVVGLGYLEASALRLALIHKARGRGTKCVETEFYEVHLLRVKVFFDPPADTVSNLTENR